MKDNTIGFEDIRLAFIAVWKSKFIAIIAAIVCLLLGFLVTINKQAVDSYRAVATVYSAVFGSYEESVDAAAAMLSYSGVVSSTKVCDRAASIVGNADIDAKEIQSMISVYTSSSSVVMSIYAYSYDPKLAQAVANAVAEAFVIEIRTITGSDAIQLLDKADTATLASDGSRSILIMRALAGLAGFAVVVLFVFVKALFSNRLRSLRQIELLEEPIVAIIPKMEK